MGKIMKYHPVAADEKTLRPRTVFGEGLMRNMLASTLVLACIVSVRTFLENPDMRVIPTLQSAIESEWDENLGRLIYANSSLSEAIAVFSPGILSNQLYQPCSTEVMDVFSTDTPYIVYQPAKSVFTATACEVSHVSKINADCYIVRTSSANGLECLYSGLSNCYVSAGDVLPARTPIGACSENPMVFEVRKNGAPLDASTMFAEQQVQ